VWSLLRGQIALRKINQLALQLGRLIENNGSISVSQFMDEANAEYYNTRDPLGADGDFITAPEVSQMFGELIGLWGADMWLRMNKPENTHYVELGPGRGTLASDALRSMTQFDFTPEVHFVETSDALRLKQKEAVSDANWHDSLENLPTDGPLIIVANEFFDALPIRQFVATHSGWRERVVARDRDQFMALPGNQPTDIDIPQGQRELPPGTILESSPVGTEMMYDLVARIKRQGGALLIIDYGYDKPGSGDTLQAVKNHEAANPFHDPGEQDITAHVNFPELANICRASDLKVSGPCSQRDFLITLGIDQRALALLESSPELEDDIRAAHHRLTDASEMGALFKVMAVTPNNWPDPEGF